MNERKKKTDMTLVRIRSAHITKEIEKILPKDMKWMEALKQSFVGNDWGMFLARNDILYWLWREFRKIFLFCVICANLLKCTLNYWYYNEVIRWRLDYGCAIVPQILTGSYEQFAQWTLEWFGVLRFQIPTYISYASRHKWCPWRVV